MASARVPSRLIEKACVGPPATIIPTSGPGSAGAWLTSIATTWSTDSPKPIAIAFAICAVLPNIDSYTTMAFIDFSFRAPRTSRLRVSLPPKAHPRCPLPTGA